MITKCHCRIVSAIRLTTLATAQATTARLDELDLSALTSGWGQPRANQGRGEIVLCKQFEDGSRAVGIFNLGERPAKLSVTWAELGLAGRQWARDLWRQKNLGTFSSRFETEVPRHSITLIKLTKP